MAETEALGILEKLGTEEAEKFIHRAINDICEKQGLCYEDYAKTMSLADFSKLRHSLTATIRQTTRGGIVRDKVSESLGDLGVSVEVTRLLAECLWVRREEIRLQLVRDSCTFSHSHLVDFDWRLKVVMSSDKLGSIHQPVLSLDLDVSEDGGGRRENLELSKEELAKMIGSLEAANKIVTQLRT